MSNFHRFTCKLKKLAISKGYDIAYLVTDPRGASHEAYE